MPDSMKIDRNSYEDIIKTDWQAKKNSSGRIPMNLNQRAKIFLPFAALSGYEQALENCLREVESRM